MAPGNLSDSRVWWHMCVIPASKIQGEGAVLGGVSKKDPRFTSYMAVNLLDWEFVISQYFSELCRRIRGEVLE